MSSHAPLLGSGAEEPLQAREAQVQSLPGHLTLESLSIPQGILL